jgi:NAD(P)H-dependent FMN reductase
MSAPKILVIPGSLRAGSLNARLAAVAAEELVQADVEVTRISLADFPLPIYDADLQAESGVPASAISLKQMIGSHHGILIVTPEYKASLPPLLKNAIDWVSVRRKRAVRFSMNARLRSRLPPQGGSGARDAWPSCVWYSRLAGRW